MKKMKVKKRRGYKPKDAPPMLDILEYLYFGLVLRYHGRVYGFLKSRIIRLLQYLHVE
jgi:hypothetical protein